MVVLRALGLGDFLTGLPALRALRQEFPHARHTLLTHPDLVDFVNYTGLLDKVIPMASLEQLPSILPSRLAGSALLVNLHGRGPQSHRALLAVWPRHLIAFANACTGVTGPRWEPGEHEVQRWCRLLSDSGIPADPGRLDLPEPPPRPDLAPAGTTIIHPGAASQSRRWPPARWADVARAETGAGHRVAITGSPQEQSLGRWIARRAGLELDACLAGSTTMVELASVVAGAGLVLSGDTGVAHLATALGRPSVVLFGPVPPAEWGPPAGRPQHVSLWAGGPGQGGPHGASRGDPHGHTVDARLLALSAADVVEAASRARAAGQRPTVPAPVPAGHG